MEWGGAVFFFETSRIDARDVGEWRGLCVHWWLDFFLSFLDCRGLERGIRYSSSSSSRVGNIMRSFCVFAPPIVFPCCDRAGYFELLVFSWNLDGVFGYEICLH